ncbi:Purple acid phosphatase 10 [Sesamum alatum]|uniref:Purple acid phosphatase n=1 Tax=Sesamum alatum TaxID=300844 RepID=A0AAE1YEW0_9LAMI|nr:Purple acid phosphatase 10 [Sesamum alatum]
MFRFWIVFCLWVQVCAVVCINGCGTSSYVRKPFASHDLPIHHFPSPPGFNAPQQAHAKTTYYRYYNYTSGYIHHATIRRLKYDTQYIYELGKHNETRRFSFTTPPQVGPDVPYTFGVIGERISGKAVLFVGDLSYADDHPFHDNRRWDSWGRFVEKSTAYQPWIWTAGNHELDLAPEIGENTPFRPYLHRYYVPYKASQSTSPLWYSIKHASAYIIVLSSYSAYGKYTPQYNWLEQELPKVNRAETPWLIVLLHSPWYNSNNYHYMEGESMRVMFESWFVKHKVDLVFAGHVHSYERSKRISNVKYNITNGLSTPVCDASAPVYITIGDGGNVEGIANKTHAHYTWHRNHDGEAVAADSTWFYNRYWYPHDEDQLSSSTTMS